ncbi:MAG: oligosaccharide flippase family protein [Candidatus Kapaibacteriales bacterium]
MKSRILSLAQDTLIYGIFILIGRFLTFLLTPFYTNYLTIEEVGDIGNIFSLIAFANVLYSFGMDSAFLRYYSSSDFSQLRSAFTNAYLGIVLISMIATICLFSFKTQIVPLLSDLPNSDTLANFAFLIPFTDTLMVIPYAYLRMERRVLAFSLIRFVLIVIAVGFNIYFISIVKTGIVGVFWAQLIANLTGIIIFLPMISKLLTFRIRFDLFEKMLKFGLPTVPATFSGILLQVVDRPILKYLTNSSEVGMYMVNYRLAIPMMLFIAMYDYAWRPFYLSHYENQDAKDLFSRIFTYFILASAFVFLISSFYVDFLVRLPFFGGRFIEPKYWSGMDIIPIVMLGYFFNGIYINFTAGINIQKVTKYLPISIVIAAIINIISNFLLIPFFGFRGSAWATLIAYFVSALVVYNFSQKVYPIKYDWKKVMIIFTLMLFIYFVSFRITSSTSFLDSFFIRTFFLFIFVILLLFSKVIDKMELTRILRVFK